MAISWAGMGRAGPAAFMPHPPPPRCLHSHLTPRRSHPWFWPSAPRVWSCARWRTPSRARGERARGCGCRGTPRSGRRSRGPWRRHGPCRCAGDLARWWWAGVEPSRASPPSGPRGRATSRNHRPAGARSSRAPGKGHGRCACRGSGRRRASGCRPWLPPEGSERVPGGLPRSLSLCVAAPGCERPRGARPGGDASTPGGTRSCGRGPRGRSPPSPAPGEGRRGRKINSELNHGEWRSAGRTAGALWPWENASCLAVIPGTRERMIKLLGSRQGKKKKYNKSEYPEMKKLISPLSLLCATFPAAPGRVPQ